MIVFLCVVVVAQITGALVLAFDTGEQDALEAEVITRRQEAARAYEQADQAFQEAMRGFFGICDELQKIADEVPGEVPSKERFLS